MQSLGQYTLSEIVSQPDTWAAAYTALVARQGAVQAAWQGAAPRQVLVTGCGSTYYLAQIAAGLLQRLTGVAARAVPASEITLYTEQVLADPAQTLLLAISRSGTTTETVAAMDRFRQRGGKTIWGITCNRETPVAQESDFALLTDMVQERSIAQTVSFSTMLLSAQGLAAIIGGHDVTLLAGAAETGRWLIENLYGLATQWGNEPGVERFFFLGSGLRYGIACEAMLKMKEMSITNSEAYHFLEFRHGPKALVDEQALVVGLLAEPTFRQEAPVLNEMGAMGGKTLALSPRGFNAGQVTVHMPPELPEWAAPVIYLPVLQIMAYARSVAKGLDPDNPRNLSAVVHLDRTTLLPEA